MQTVRFSKSCICKKTVIEYYTGRIQNVWKGENEVYQVISLPEHSF